MSIGTQASNMEQVHSHSWILIYCRCPTATIERMKVPCASFVNYMNEPIQKSI
jgi:hypothetical protein